MFLSGIGFLIIGEGLNGENSIHKQNWIVVIVGILFVGIALIFAKSALKLASFQSRLDTADQNAHVPPEDIAKDIHTKKGRYFKF
jgi:hypothetical protein